MNCRHSAKLATFACLLTIATLCHAQINYKYTTFNHPGAASTTANGINNNNAIVGSWTDSKNVTRGYKYKNGQFTTIVFPGATSTVVKGINDYGDMVGYYILDNNYITHGFLMHDGKFTTIDYPGFGATSANGINKYGTIVGAADNNGFIYQNGKYRIFNAPSNAGPDTYLNGIANTGQIVGQDFSYDDWRSFLLAGSDLDFKSPPGALDSEAYGVNGHGDVVGFSAINGGYLALNPEAGETEGTEKSAWKTQLIAPGGNKGAVPMSINYARMIVGTAGNSAFLAIPQ